MIFLFGVVLPLLSAIAVYVAIEMYAGSAKKRFAPSKDGGGINKPNAPTLETYSSAIDEQNAPSRAVPRYRRQVHKVSLPQNAPMTATAAVADQQTHTYDWCRFQ
mmetsp:Transcript_38018/g.91702  ORF Transcript_38018/g.91702 Transcript_38018/m.91702 type:complete len:105 (-) Transcript_38018:53-367(-)